MQLSLVGCFGSLEKIRGLAEQRVHFFSARKYILTMENHASHANVDSALAARTWLA